MYTIKTESEFLSDLRSIDERLNKIKISSVVVGKNEHKVTYNFICDKTIDDELKSKILGEVEKITAPVFKSVEITVKKIVAENELCGNEIYKFLKDNFPSISIFLKKTDINCDVFGDNVKYVLRLNKDGIEYVTRNSLISKINEHLRHKFCSDFLGSTEQKDEGEIIDILSEDVFEGELEKIEHRTIRVKDVVIIDDDQMGDLAEYIEDVTSGEAVICGRVTKIVEKETKTGKPFFIIHVDDTTGRVSGLYFSKKATCQKIRDITEGECIIARGSMGEYNGTPSFTFNKINRCTFPEDFKKKDRYKKSAPKSYHLIFPEPAESVRVESVFDLNSKIPDMFMGRDFVSFDLETTGLEVLKDNITDVGAVKIRDGKIIEQFSSLINPDKIITEKITELTGITNDMVKDAPRFSAVLPDFMKFIDGCAIIGHNVEFDLSFIKKFAREADYEVKGEVFDTWALSKKLLPTLKKFDLDTVADNFNISFNHHRALSDARATAQVFIELMKIAEKE